MLGDHTEKRAPACINCRRLKVKCVHSVLDDITSPCIRCIKGKRECKFQTGGRKRRTTYLSGHSASARTAHSAPQNYLKPSHIFPTQEMDESPSFSSSSSLEPKNFRSVPTIAQMPIMSAVPGGTPTSSSNGTSVTPQKNLEAAVWATSNNHNNYSHQSPLPVQSLDSPHGMHQSAPTPTHFSSQVTTPITGVAPQPPPVQVHVSQYDPQSPCAAGMHPPVGPMQQPQPLQPAMPAHPNRPQDPLKGYGNMTLSSPEKSDWRRRFDSSIGTLGPLIAMIRENLISIIKENSEMSQQYDEAAYAARSYRCLSVPANNIVVQGILTEEQATHRLDSFWRQCPLTARTVCFTPQTSMQHLISEWPLSFHVIMAHASAALPSSSAPLQQVALLNQLVLTSILTVLVYECRKSLDAIQALTLVAQGFFDLETKHRQRSIGLLSMALSTGYDLGLGVSYRYAQSSLGFESTLIPHRLLRNDTLECYATWLTLYCDSFVVATATQVPLTPKWNTYTHNAYMALAHVDPVTLPHLRVLAQTSQYVRLLEQIVHELYMFNNEPSLADYTSQTVQYLMQHFDEEIEKLRVGPNDPNYSLYLTTLAFLHQTVLYTSYNPKRGRSFYTLLSLNLEGKEVTPFMANCLKKCYESSTACVKYFLTQNPDEIVLLPRQRLFHYVFCATLALKCRIITTMNPVYRPALQVSSDSADSITDMISFMDKMSERYPYAYVLRSLTFVMKVILCRGDLHFKSTNFDVEASLPVVGADAPVLGGAKLSCGVEEGDFSSLFAAQTAASDSMLPIWNLGDEFWRDITQSDDFGLEF